MNTLVEPEIFASLQGEGPSTGMPVAFLRLSRCNLACTWCDTRYTWDFDRFDRKENQLTLDITDVAQRVLLLNQNRLVITGGEPLLQAGRLADLLGLLPDLRVEIVASNRYTDLLDSGKMFSDLGLPALDPANDRIMICGSPQMLKDLKHMLEVRNFKEGNTTTPGDFVIERAFADQ